MGTSGRAQSIERYYQNLRHSQITERKWLTRDGAPVREFDRFYSKWKKDYDLKPALNGDWFGADVKAHRADGKSMVDFAIRAIIYNAKVFIRQIVTMIRCEQRHRRECISHPTCRQRDSHDKPVSNITEWPASVDIGIGKDVVVYEFEAEQMGKLSDRF